MNSFSLVFLSWLIVAFGQPAWLPFLSPLAAGMGYALFWKALLPIQKPVTRFFTALGWYALVQAVQLSWLFSLTPEYRDGFIFAAYFALIVWLGAQFGFLSVFIHSLSTRKILALASFWTLLEWARQHYFLCGFSLNPAGIALAAFPLPMQLASVFGILGLSFWVMVTNLVGLQAWIQKQKWGYWVSFALLLLFPYFFGMGHQFYNASKQHVGSSLSIGLVQTGLKASEKMPIAGYVGSFISPVEQWKRILGLVKSKEGEVFDLLVLPEGAVPFGFDGAVYSLEYAKAILSNQLKKDTSSFVPPLEAPFAYQKPEDHSGQWRVTNAFFAQALANYLNAEVVIGLDAEDKKKQECYNAAFHFSPGNSLPQRYEKRILLPVAEYLPFSGCGVLAQQFGLSEFFTPGKEAKVFQSKIPLSLSICYEETFSYLMRESRQKGAALFVNLTNDNWYPDSRLAAQHYSHGLIRTVENGVPLLRACNTGVTAAIDAFGQPVAALKEDGAGILAVKINLHHYKTLYTLWGDLGILSLCFLFLILFTWTRLQGKN
jgi:apolipoprotein N-acyltransferase